MPDPAERLVNLALFLAAAREPVSAAQIQAQVAGYPAGQATSAFLRMFERDKEDLLSAGLVLEVVRTGDTERYRLDRDSTFAGEIELDRRDAVMVRAAGASLTEDPSFPFAEDLRLALAKVAAASGTAPIVPPDVPAVSLMADEDPEAQSGAVALIAGALAAHKTVSFSYTNLQGEQALREVEPYGIFARDGRWYLVGRDRGADGMRVFAVARVSDLKANTVKPKSPDFEPPDGFDIREWMALPFQYGADRTEAVLRLSGPGLVHAAALAGARGTVEWADDGSATVRTTVADPKALAAWCVANGPGIVIVEPPDARAALADGLRRVEAAHA